jgi:hypothetical protein
VVWAMVQTKTLCGRHTRRRSTKLSGKMTMRFLCQHGVKGSPAAQGFTACNGGRCVVLNAGQRIKTLQRGEEGYMRRRGDRKWRRGLEGKARGGIPGTDRKSHTKAPDTLPTFLTHVKIWVSW